MSPSSGVDESVEMNPSSYRLLPKKTYLQFTVKASNFV